MKSMLIIILLLSISLPVQAGPVIRKATITDAIGTVEAKIDKGKWQAAQEGMQLSEGDFVRTKAGSTARLKLEGDVETAQVELQPNSQMVIAELQEDVSSGTTNTLLDLALGKVLITAQKLHARGSRFEVKTPTSIVGVRGTVFAVEVEQLSE